MKILIYTKIIVIFICLIHVFIISYLSIWLVQEQALCVVYSYNQDNDSCNIPPLWTNIWAGMRENLSSGFPSKRDSNQSPELQRLARKLKFCL